MTKQDTVSAYIRGDLDRRSFIRRLTAVGVSAGAAMAYATALVPGVSAGSGRNGAGYITRMQDADPEYGIAIIIEDVPAALAATVAAVEDAAALAGAILDAFTAEDFAAAGLGEDDLQILSDIADQMQQHVEALQGILAALGGDDAQGGASGDETGATAPAGDLMEQLAALAEQLREVTGMYVALAPSIENVEDRQLLSQMTAVAGRHAALVAYMAGENPVPEPFETPVNPIAD